MCLVVISLNISWFPPTVVVVVVLSFNLNLKFKLVVPIEQLQRPFANAYQKTIQNHSDKLVVRYRW